MRTQAAALASEKRARREAAGELERPEYEGEVTAEMLFLAKERFHVQGAPAQVVSMGF